MQFCVIEWLREVLSEGVEGVGALELLAAHPCLAPPCFLPAREQSQICSKVRRRGEMAEARRLHLRRAAASEKGSGRCCVPLPLLTTSSSSSLATFKHQQSFENEDQHIRHSKTEKKNNSTSGRRKHGLPTAGPHRPRHQGAYPDGSGSDDRLDGVPSLRI